MMLLSDGARGASRAPTRRRRPRAHAPPSPSCMVRMHEMHLRPGHHIWPRASSGLRPRRGPYAPRDARERARVLLVEGREAVSRD